MMERLFRCETFERAVWTMLDDTIALLGAEYGNLQLLTGQQLVIVAQPNLTDAGTLGDGGNLFHYDATTQEYVFNLSTKGLSAPATYQIVVTLDDGTDPFIYGHVVNFSLKP